MKKRRTRLRRLFPPTPLLGLALLLSSCAKGDAHLKINRNGTADLSMEMTIDDRTLGLIGKPDLMAELAERLKKTGLDAEAVERDGQAGLSATKHMNLRDWDGRKLALPDGVEIEREATKHWLYTRQHVAVTVDLPRLIDGAGNGGDDTLTAKITGLSPLVRKLAQSQLDFDFLLTAPLKPGANNADESRDGGRTLGWQLSLFEPNRFEVSFNVPDIRRLAYVAGAGLLALLAAAVFAYRAYRKRRARSD